MNRTRLINNLFYVSTLLVVSGILLKISKYETAPWIYLFGAVLFTVSRIINFSMLYKKVRGRILHIQLFSGISLLVSAWFMFRGSNSWSVFVLIAAVIELYASFRGGNFQEKT